MQKITSETVISLLNEDADRIKKLIKQQSNILCIAQCKAFEEVVDTQMFGLSREVLFAVRLGLLSDEQGQTMMADLERELNQMYSSVYDRMEQGGKTDGNEE